MPPYIESSELIINADGSVFHLHLKPGEIADDIILVGDPGRVELVASFFDEVELKRNNREFVAVTGWLNKKRLTVVSTGIGTDNIDIVINELDALVNVDFITRKEKEVKKSLNFVRIGTSGSLQSDIPVDSWLISNSAIGFDGLLHFYQSSTSVFIDKPMKAFIAHTKWPMAFNRPYMVNSGNDLLTRIKVPQMVGGITISAPGFYGPQGRVIRLPLAHEHINELITSFRHESLRVTNYEMECSAIYGLSKLLGHQAVTVCAIIANRLAGTYSKDYHPVVKGLVEIVLKQLTAIN